MSAMGQGRLFVVSGPSGAGKGTVVREVLGRKPDLVLSVSATTRPARQGEREGID
jgi:guanylate kinase